MKTVVITGATKGIGLATSLKLADLGYNVVGIARNSPSNYPGEFFQCNLESIEATAATITQINQHFKVDAIVNNVGIVLPEPLEEVTLDNLNKAYDLNVRAAVQVAQAFTPNMKANHYGKIINIASRAIFGVKNRSSYAAAKSALIGLTKTWAVELAPFNIMVNAVAPGPIETELFRKAQPVGSMEEQRVLQNIPLNRIGKPSEIADTIAFLLSDGADFITGQTICVDGGGSL